MSQEARTCEDCKFCILEDTGYSNYTVEGTDFNCAKKLHPDGVFDRFYGEEDKMKFAQKCSEFEKGNKIEIDVEGENIGNFTPEQKQIYDAWRKA